MSFFRNIRYISLRKIWNLCRLHKFYRKAKNGKLIGEVPLPSFASYEPTNICNLSCEMCPSGKGLLKRSRGTADMELYRKFILENRKTLTNIILHFQGEPLVCQQFGEMIAFARQNRIYTMFSTNGQLLAQNIDLIRNARPDRIIVSLDGLTDETYTKYRVSGNLQNVFDGLEKLSQLHAKERPYIELQFLVFSHNEHEIPELKNLKKKYRIDKITLKSAQIYEKSQVDFLPENQKFSRYEVSENGNFKLKNGLKNQCKRLIFGTVVCFDGRVVPCCFDKDADYELGNIASQSLYEIRNSKKYIDFVNKVFSNRNEISICNNCTE
ncbi:MAG: SPASM domain-containing protein [Bacteroidales bacterium]|nr:SPASM domain-containing protein [Bacteroidales bacterium]